MKLIKEISTSGAEFVIISERAAHFWDPQSMTLLPKGRLDFIFLDAQTDVGQVIVPNPECHYAKIYSDGKNAMIIIYSFGEILPDFAFQSILTNKILIQIRMDRKDKLVIMDSKTTSEGALDGEIALIDFSGKNFFCVSELSNKDFYGIGFLLID